MCPFCKEQDVRRERAAQRAARLRVRQAFVADSRAFLETCRRQSLTVVHTVHDWTQSH